MSDSRVRDDARPAQWLELRPDALAWIAGKRDTWWRTAEDGTRRSLNLPRISADTGLDDSTVYRLAAYSGKGGRAPLSIDTVAQLVRLGAVERGVKDETAFARIFRIHDPAENRALTRAVAA